jgi:hypothetical protein
MKQEIWTQMCPMSAYLLPWPNRSSVAVYAVILRQGYVKVYCRFRGFRVFYNCPTGLEVVVFHIYIRLDLFR